MGEVNRALRALPGVDRVMASLAPDTGPLVATAARKAVAEARAEALREESSPDFEAIVESARNHLVTTRRLLLGPVLNATGVIVHTNLGRIPLGERQIAAVIEAAAGYSNLEFDLASGRRGSRHAGIASLISSMTGAESALVTNNNAAAVLVSLAALCGGREVVISRGELVEIGGGFRIPDVMASSGAKLIEVGTTNRTHLRDYEQAIGPDTAAILKVHRSNYQIVGFTAEVDHASLARLGRGRGVPLLYDIGSGLLDGGPELTRREPTVTGALDDGVDLVMFSGDKLLGGPQSGIVAGREDLVSTVARHPLMRAVRPDKLTLAALQATLLAYADSARSSLPLWQISEADTEELEQRAIRLAESVQRNDDDLKAEAIPTGSVTGGGSLPGESLRSWAVAVTHGTKSLEDLEQSLRSATPPVIARIDDGKLILDLRCIPEAKDQSLIDALLGGRT